MILKENEKSVQKAWIDFWSGYGAVVVKVNNVGIKKPDGSYIPSRQKGISDLIILYKGVPIFAEIKGSDGRVSEEQKLFLEGVKRANGVALVARSIDDALLLKYKIDIMINKAPDYGALQSPDII